METLYQQDLAFIQAAGFGEFAHGAAPEIVRRLRAARSPVGKVVEVGCGAGPLTVTLVDAGFAVTGIEVSAELLIIARSASPTAEFIEGSIYDQEIPRCQAILAIGEPLTYHEGADADARVHEFFRRASRVLPQGGILIFDVIEVGEPPLAGRFWKAGEEWAVLVETLEDPSSRTLVRDIETFRKIGESYRRGHERHRVRLFSTPEVCQWLDEAGFSVSTAQGYGEFRLPLRRRAFFCTKRNTI
jgi:SAM-dependent methyltransferase